MVLDGSQCVSVSDYTGGPCKQSRVEVSYSVLHNAMHISVSSSTHVHVRHV